MTSKESSPVSELVDRMREIVRNWECEETREDWWQHQKDHAEAADRLTALEAENAQLRDRVKAERGATIDDVFLTVGECLAGMGHGQVSPHARRKIEAAINAARRVREGGKVDG